MSAINYDPRLSEFSLEQLDAAADAIEKQIIELQNKVNDYRKLPEIELMFADELRQWEARLENLRTVYTQLFNAGTKKEIERRMISN